MKFGVWSKRYQGIYLISHQVHLADDFGIDVEDMI